MRISINRRDPMFYQLALFCLYKIALAVVYNKGIVPTYYYVGFLSNYSLFNDLIGWLLFVVLSIRLVMIDHNKGAIFSKAVGFTLFLLIYTPFSVAFSFGMYDSPFFIANNIYWFVLIFFLASQSKKRLKPIPHLIAGSFSIGEKFVEVFGVASLVLILYISWKYTGFRLNLSILNVYVLRSEARAYSMPTIIRYMFGWTRIVNSICLCMSLVRRKKIMPLVFLFNQFLSFGIDGMKSSLFIMILDILIYVFYRFKLYKNEFTFIALGFNAFAIGAIAEMLLFKTKWLVYLIAYRMEFLPVNISYHFYDFFTHHEPDYFRSSFLRLFGFESPYENINYMISGVYSGDYSSQANNGLISDAITNMGYSGIVLMPIILVLFLHLFDRCCQGINNYLIITLAMYCAMTFSNMFFLTNLLTGGWIVALLLVILMNRDQTYLKKKDETRGINNENSDRSWSKAAVY